MLFRVSSKCIKICIKGNIMTYFPLSLNILRRSWNIFPVGCYRRNEIVFYHTYKNQTKLYAMETQIKALTLQFAHFKKNIEFYYSHEN